MKTILIAVLATAACAKSAGGPLAHTFDNSKIAGVPLEQKQTVTEAQQQYDVAQLRRTTVDTEYKHSEIEQDLAEYQADHAIVASQIVARDFAKGAAPTNESAAIARKTADAKVSYMQSRRGWLERASEAAQYAVYASQARLELERARVAQTNNLTAPGFDLQVFQRQFEDRDTASKRAADAAEADRKTAEQKLAAWAELEKQALAAGSLKGPIEADHFAPELKAPPAAEPAQSQPLPQPDPPPAQQPAAASPPAP